jgi:hypothetical protein
VFSLALLPLQIIPVWGAGKSPSSRLLQPRVALPRDQTAVGVGFAARADSSYVSRHSSGFFTIMY